MAPETAGQILEEVVTLLLYRWENVTRPETWLLEMLNRRSEALREEGEEQESSEDETPDPVKPGIAPSAVRRAG